MRTISKPIALFLAMLTCLTLAACRQEPDTQDHVHIYGKTLYFYTDEQKKDWEAPLAALLSNVAVPYGEHGEYLGTTPAVDPNAPTTPMSHYCGLFDVTRDGIPELLLFPYGGGGSAGNALYEVFDIFTGKQIGYLEGGFDKSWCWYYHPDTGLLTAFGQYSWRMGWSGRERYVSELYYNSERNEYDSRVYLYAYYEISGEMNDTQPTDQEGIYSGDWVETYPAAVYRIYDRKVSMDDHYAQYQRLTTEYVRIPETALCLLSWSDVCGDEEDYAVRGQQMARALLETEQEFIDYTKQH